MVALKLSPTRTIIRGDSDKFQITFKKQVNTGSKKAGSCSCLNGIMPQKQVTYPIDITGWNIRFTVRPEVPTTDIVSDDDALISEEAEIIDAENGVAMIYVKSDNTTALIPGTYYYDIQVIKPVDEFGYRQVSSIRKGKYIVIGDITRREDVYPASDFKIVYNGETYNILLENVSCGSTSSEKVILSNVRVISEKDGHIILGYVPESVTPSLPDKDEDDNIDDGSHSNEDADDGYTI